MRKSGEIVEEKIIKTGVETNEILKIIEKNKTKFWFLKRSRIQRLLARPRKGNLKRKGVFSFLRIITADTAEIRRSLEMTG